MRGRIAGVLLVCAVAVLGMASHALAHAELERSDPTAGAQLATAPAGITLTFTEAPDPSLSRIDVSAAGGAPVETGPVTAGANARQVATTLPPLANGSYTVSWRVVAEDDGHVTAGTFAFGVRTAALAPASGAPRTPSPTPLGVIAKALLYAGLSLVVGTAATGLWAFGGHVPSRRLLLPCAGVVALAGALLLVAAERATIGVSLGALLRSPTGRPLIWLAVGAMATAVAAAVASRDDTRGPLAVAGVAAVITMYTRAEGGHAATGGEVQVLLQWAHFVAVGVWIGGLVPVLLLLRERRRTDAPAPVQEVTRYSSMAGWAVLVLVAAGLARAVNELGGVGALRDTFDTGYGITLAVKVAIALVLIGLGAVNRRRSLPRLPTSDRPLRRLMTVEVVGALGVFALTGLLTALPPGGSVTPPTDAASPQVSVSSPVAGQPTLYTITLASGQQLQAYNDPGSAGTNQLHLTAFDAQGKELPLASATMVATPQGGSARALDVTRFGAGHFVASVDLADGPWHFDLGATARDGTVLSASFDQTIG